MAGAFETPKSDYKLTVDKTSSTMIRVPRNKPAANVFMTGQKKSTQLHF